MLSMVAYDAATVPERAMTMQEIEHFTDDRHKGYCAHCGNWVSDADATRDHVPTKTLLAEPYPSNLPFVRSCRPCNQAFTNDEQYLVCFLSSALSGTTDPDLQNSASARRILRYRDDLRQQVESTKKEFVTIGGEKQIFWKPDIGRIERIVVKNARGHALYDSGEPMIEDPTGVLVSPLVSMSSQERADFEQGVELAGWPEVGSRMMTRIMTGIDMDGQWVVLQKGTYRYTLTMEGGVTVCSVMSEYLATEVQW